VLMVYFRKKAVLISCIPAYIGAVLCVVCQLAAAPELLMIGRFVTGLNCGVYTDTCGLFYYHCLGHNVGMLFFILNNTTNRLILYFGII